MSTAIEWTDETWNPTTGRDALDVFERVNAEAGAWLETHGEG